MAALGPFEPEPVIVVGVSGGADSMALTILADAWCRQRGGRAIAVTVNHGLRPGSAGEAAEVGRWMHARHIGHHILNWTDAKPAAALQASARKARYRLLTDFCRNQGLLHLAVAHTGDDQLETYFMRRRRGVGLGLAAMAPLRTLAGIRLIRPVLSLSHAEICAWLQAEAIPWLEDPSNRNQRFERVRVREDLMRATAPLKAEMALERAQWSAARQHYQRQTAEDFSAAVRLYPMAMASVDRSALTLWPAERAEAVLTAAAAMVGNHYYPLSRERFSRFWAAFPAGAGQRSVFGKVMFHLRRKEIWLFPEPGRLPEPVPITPSETIIRLFWSSYEIEMQRIPGAGSVSIGALGAAGTAAIRQCSATNLNDLTRRIGCVSPPVAAYFHLPGLWRDGELIDYPRFIGENNYLYGKCFTARFLPQKPALSDTGLTIRNPDDDNMGKY